MRGATAHDWPVGNTCGRCAVGALGGAPLTSCLPDALESRHLQQYQGAAGHVRAYHLLRRRRPGRARGEREWHMETG